MNQVEVEVEVEVEVIDPTEPAKRLNVPETWVCSFAFCWSLAEQLPLSPRSPFEAIAEMQKAIAIDPFSAPMQSFLGRTYIWAREYDKAFAQFRRSAEMFPGFSVCARRWTRSSSVRQRAAH